MSRPGTVRTWLGLCLLAALAACGGSGGGGGGPPDPGGLPVGPPSAYLQFHHPVSGRALASGASYEYPHSLRPGERMQPFFLPAAESIPDPVPITYVLEPPWPPGLEYSPVSRALRGTLRAGGAHPPSYRLDYRASSPGHRDVHLSVVLHLPPTLRSTGFTAVSFPIGQRTVRVMPAASGGRPPYTYELAGCAVPTWIRREGRALHGSPTAANQHESDRDCRWRVTDLLGGTAEFRTRISVETGGRSQLYFPRADGTPYADGASLGSLGTLVQGEEVPPRTGFFPAALGAPRESIRYRLEVASGPPGVQLPPNGLGIDTAGPSLTGTINDPEWPAGTYSLYYVASVPNYADARLTVSFDLESPLRLGDSSIGPIKFQVGRFARRSLPEAAGGTPPYRYALDQCPLAWLELVGTELAANPQPEHTGERRLCKYRVTDATGNFADLVLEVEATPVPINVFQFENRHIVDRDLPLNTAIIPIVLPRAVNGTAPVKYELSPVLPSGLTFHPPTGPSSRPEVRGTPTSISLLTRYCVHATDRNGDTAVPRCFQLRTVGHEVPRFTVSLGSVREVFLFSRLRFGDGDEAEADTNPPSCTPRFITLPAAFLPPSWKGDATYSIVPVLDAFSFNSDSRQLTSVAVSLPACHPLPTPVVYTYGVRRDTGETDDDDKSNDGFFAAAICFELGRRIVIREVPPNDATHVYEDHYLTVTFRDEAVRSSTGEYLCHPNPRGDDDPATGSTAQSNPVHDALGMVHARRAVRLAHELIGERVRGPSPDGAGAALFSDVDLGRMWGRSGGFSWSGTGESLLGGAQVVHRGGALQLGLVAGFHRTALDYRAEAVRLEGRYSEGEHVTELYAMHPFAAWRFATDSVVWGSVGAGAGSLWFEDEAPPFDERWRSNLDLGSAALGFSHPLPSSPLGTFSFSGLAEHIALRIEGDDTEHGIRPRSLRGSDFGLGLDWRRRPVDAEPSLVPSLSLGVRHQTGDGAAGSLIDVAGSIAYRPSANPLSFDVGASTLLGIAGNDSGSWDVRASARFDPDPGARGLKLSLRSVLGAASNDPRATYGLDGELAYGLFGGAFGSTVRPYIAISSFAGASGARRAAGLHLRDEPDYRLSLETFGHTGTDSDGMKLRLHRLWP